MVCQILMQTSAKEFKISFQFSFSQPNGSAQRTMAVIGLPRMNRLFLSESECHILCTLDEMTYMISVSLIDI